jgi:hypothetical protein
MSCRGKDTAAVIGGRLSQPGVHVVVSTIYQLAKLPVLFDVIVIDEATQMLLVDSALVVNKLRGNGRLALFGDHLQLEPVIHNPQSWDDVARSNPTLAPIVSSIFLASTQQLHLKGQIRPRSSSSLAEKEEGLEEEEEEDSHKFVQLVENYRSTPAISCFTRQLYRDYETAIGSPPASYTSVLDHPSARQSCASARFGVSSLSQGLTIALVDPFCEIFCVEIKSIDSKTLMARDGDTLKDLEADIAARAALSFAAFPWQTGSSDGGAVFVITPHHTQRLRVNQRIATLCEGCSAEEERARARVTVNTVDSLQGSEAEFVVICLCFPVDELNREFIFHLNRLNVALSRASRKLLLIVSAPVLEQSLEVSSSIRQFPAYSHIMSLCNNTFCKCPGRPHDSYKIDI